jgi:hypothetical protein
LKTTLPFLPLNYASIMPAKTRIQRCLCREVDEIWQYRTGGSLTIFDKDHETAEAARSNVLVAKHTASLQLKLDARTESATR